MQTCETCMWWKHHDGFDGGNCRRYPPQLVVLPGFDPAHASVENHWPYTDATDACGEHAPKEKADD